MHLLESFRRTVGKFRDEERREMDERQLQSALFAIRDAFVALVVLSALQMVVQIYTLRTSNVELMHFFALLPMASITLALLVLLFSWRVRGGGFSRGLIAFRTSAYLVSSVIGCLAGWAIILALARADVASPPRADSLIVYLVGLGVGLGAVYLVLRRKNPPED